MTFVAIGEVDPLPHDGGAPAAHAPAVSGPSVGPGRGTSRSVYGDVDVSMVRAYVEALAALSRSRAASDALEAALFADLVSMSGASGRSSDADLALRSLAAEVGAVLHVSDRTVQRRMSDAFQLVEQFPAVHEALSRGEVTSSHVSVILHAGLPVEPGPAREAFVARVLPLARVESPNRLRGMVARVAEEVRDVGITARHREARRARAVWITDEHDGMATVHAHLPAVLAHGVKDRLDQMAHAVRATRPQSCPGARDSTLPHDGADRGTGPRVGAGQSVHTRVSADQGVGAPRVGDTGDDVGVEVDVRTVDQIRADLFADLLLTSTPSSVDTGIGSIHATVAVTVPVLTLTGHDDTGAELDGAIPIDADTARLLAGGESGWDRVLTHPITGAILTTDRYRPTADIRRLLTHRDQHCRHPGCRVPIRYADIDHNHDWAHGGATAADNLAPLCRRHHTLKTNAGWKLRPHPDDDGSLVFITPAGYHHTQAPASVSFTTASRGTSTHASASASASAAAHGSAAPAGSGSASPFATASASGPASASRPASSSTPASAPASHDTLAASAVTPDEQPPW